VKQISTSCLLERPAPGPDFTLLIEARDFWRTHAPKLTLKQRLVVTSWMGGLTCQEIAHAHGVSDRAIQYILSAALVRLRELAGVR
jgi:DNA-directed RNA polymerase specialized sigma24 family protein